MSLVRTWLERRPRTSFYRPVDPPETEAELAWWRNEGQKPVRLRFAVVYAGMAVLMVAAPTYAQWILHPGHGFPWIRTLVGGIIAAPVMVSAIWITIYGSLRTRAIHTRRLLDALRKPDGENAPVHRS